MRSKYAARQELVGRGKPKESHRESKGSEPLRRDPSAAQLRSLGPRVLTIDGIDLPSLGTSRFAVNEFISRTVSGPELYRRRQLR